MVSSLGELGAVSVHVQAALSTFLAGPIKEATEKAKAEIDFDMRGDAAYPFRKVIRAATATQRASSVETAPHREAEASRKVAMELCRRSGAKAKKVR